MHQQASLVLPEALARDPGAEWHAFADPATSDGDLHQTTASRRQQWLQGDSHQGQQGRLDLEEVFQCLPSGLVLLDSKGVIQRCNLAALRLLGTPLKGKLWREVIASVFRPRLDDGHELSLHNGRRVQVLTHPLFKSPGQLILINDVTETRELQQRVSRQQRLATLGQMMASLAHQVRTPLSAALLYARQLQGAGLKQATRARFSAKVVARLQDLERLILELLVFARGAEFERQPVVLTELFDEVADILEPQLSEAGARLSVQISDDIVLDCSRQGLKTVLQNLLVNAMQMVPGDVTVSLRGRQLADGRVEISVIDDGPGIAAEVESRLFDPFVTTRSNGTGLGLAVVRTIVEAHGGEVRVGRAAGGGAEFRLLLPATIADRNSRQSGVPAHRGDAGSWEHGR